MSATRTTLHPTPLARAVRRPAVRTRRRPAARPPARRPPPGAGIDRAFALSGLLLFCALAAASVYTVIYALGV